jgi:hypothetical protein
MDDHWLVHHRPDRFTPFASNAGRFHIPLIEPDVQISRIRLSDKNSRFRMQRLLQFLTILSELIGFPI